MKLRLLHIGPCILLVVASAILFGIATVIAAVTRDNEPLVWTRSCALAVANGAPMLTCGDHADKFTSLPAAVVAALKGHELPVLCRGYRTRGPASGITLECGETK